MEHLKRPTHFALGALFVSLSLLIGLKLFPFVVASSLWPIIYVLLGLFGGCSLLTACSLLIFRAVVKYPGIRVPTSWPYLMHLSVAILLPSAAIAFNAFMLNVTGKLITATEEMAKFGPDDGKHIERFLKITEVPRDHLIKTSQDLGSHFYIFRGEIIEVMGISGQREFYKPNERDRATRADYKRATSGLNSKKAFYLFGLSAVIVAVFASFAFGIVYRRRHPPSASRSD